MPTVRSREGPVYAGFLFVDFFMEAEDPHFVLADFVGGRGAPKRWRGHVVGAGRGLSKKSLPRLFGPGLDSLVVGTGPVSHVAQSALDELDVYAKLVFQALACERSEVAVHIVAGQEQPIPFKSYDRLHTPTRVLPGDFQRGRHDADRAEELLKEDDSAPVRPFVEVGGEELLAHGCLQSTG